MTRLPSGWATRGNGGRPVGTGAGRGAPAVASAATEVGDTVAEEEPGEVAGEDAGRSRRGEPALPGDPGVDDTVRRVTAGAGVEVVGADGAAPDRAIPDGAAPDGAAPDGAAADGAAADGAAPDGAGAVGAGTVGAGEGAAGAGCLATTGRLAPPGVPAGRGAVDTGAGEAGGADAPARVPGPGERPCPPGLLARVASWTTARAGTASRARSCEVSIGPAAVTSSSRRTGTARPTRRSVIRPGVQFFSSGTCWTTRGRPRGPRVGAAARRRKADADGVWGTAGVAGAVGPGAAEGDAIRRASCGASDGGDAGATRPAVTAGAHQRGGRMSASPSQPDDRAERTPGPRRSRRTSADRPTPVANREAALATLPTAAARGRPQGPGHRRWWAAPAPTDVDRRTGAAGAAGWSVVTRWPGCGRGSRGARPRAPRRGARCCRPGSPGPASGPGRRRRSPTTAAGLAVPSMAVTAPVARTSLLSLPAKPSPEDFCDPVEQRVALGDPAPEDEVGPASSDRAPCARSRSGRPRRSPRRRR